MPDINDLTTDGYKRLRKLFREGDSYDAWGNAMEFFFAVAHVLWHETAEPIPSAWGYGHSPVCDRITNDDEWTAYDIRVMLADEEITEDDLLTFGWVLDKYTNAMRAAGMNY